MALYGEKLSFKVSLRSDGWVGGRVPDYNATSGPQLTAEADISSVRLVSWGQVWQQKVSIFHSMKSEIKLIIRVRTLLGPGQGSHPLSQC